MFANLAMQVIYTEINLTQMQGGGERNTLHKYNLELVSQSIESFSLIDSWTERK